MKKLFISLLVLGGIAISSCSSDPCKDKSATTLCSGNGTLSSNGTNCNCTCNAGYEGTNCSTLSVTKFVGTWTAVDNDGSSTIGPYSAAIATNTAVDNKTIVIGNFSDLSSPVTATVSGTTLTIANQVLGTAYTVSGSGTYSSTTTGAASISMKYTIIQVSTGSSKSYTGTWTK